MTGIAALILAGALLTAPTALAIDIRVAPSPEENLADAPQVSQQWVVAANG